MNIPEGWKLVPVEPTEEMLSELMRPKAGAQSVSSQMHADYRAMLAAAPTPLAQEDEPRFPRPCNGRPDDLTMAECILAGECGCTVKGHEYAQSKAQDDEPVGYVSIDYQGHMMRNKGKATVHESNPNPAFFIGVYTRPDSELRKAATEAERLLTHLADSRRLLNGQFQILRKLRAALKEPS